MKFATTAAVAALIAALAAPAPGRADELYDDR